MAKSKSNKKGAAAEVARANNRTAQAQEQASVAVAFLDAILPSADLLDNVDSPADAQRMLVRGRMAHEATEFMSSGLGGALFARLGPWGRLAFAGVSVLGGVLQVALPEQNGGIARLCDVASGLGKGGNGVFVAEATGGATTKGALKAANTKATTLDQGA